MTDETISEISQPIELELENVGKVSWAFTLNFIKIHTMKLS